MLKSTIFQQIFNQFSVKCTEAKISRFQKQHSQKQSLKALEKDLNKEFFPLSQGSNNSSETGLNAEHDSTTAGSGRYP